MLSPYFPEWLVYLATATTSPVIALFGDKIPRRLKPIAIFGLCAAIAGYVVLTTPLEIGDMIDQIVILFGIATAGYTGAVALKPSKNEGFGMIGTIVASILLGVGVAGVAASLAQGSGPVEPAPTPELPQGSVQLIALALLSTGAGYVARLIRKWISF